MIRQLSRWHLVQMVDTFLLAKLQNEACKRTACLAAVICWAVHPDDVSFARYQEINMRAAADLLAKAHCLEVDNDAIQHVGTIQQLLMSKSAPVRRQAKTEFSGRVTAAVAHLLEDA